MRPNSEFKCKNADEATRRLAKKGDTGYFIGEAVSKSRVLKPAHRVKYGMVSAVSDNL
jgi:hypothetical protein